MVVWKTELFSHYKISKQVGSTHSVSHLLSHKPWDVHVQVVLPGLLLCITKGKRALAVKSVFVSSL